MISLLWTVSSTDSVALGTLPPLSSKKLDHNCWKIHVLCEVRLELWEDVESWDIIVFIFNEWPAFKSLGQLKECLPVNVRWPTECHMTHLRDMMKVKPRPSSMRSLSQMIDVHHPAFGHSF